MNYVEQGCSVTLLYSLTIYVSKELLRVYDKPLVCYSLKVLMLANINDILIITTPEDQEQYNRVPNYISQGEISLSLKIQLRPNRQTQAFVSAEKFYDGLPSALTTVTNLYFVDETEPSLTQKVISSERGELEVTPLLRGYLDRGELTK